MVNFSRDVATPTRSAQITSDVQTRSRHHARSAWRESGHGGGPVWVDGLAPSRRALCPHWPDVMATD